MMPFAFIHHRGTTAKLNVVFFWHVISFVAQFFTHISDGIMHYVKHVKNEPPKVIALMKMAIDKPDANIFRKRSNLLFSWN